MRSVGSYSYSVAASGLSPVPYNLGWEEGYWYEEHDNPEDPDEVTGSHWVDGRYNAGFDWVTASFGSASIQFSLQNGTAQTISFTNPGSRTVNDVFSFNATASSGLPVSYSLLTGGGTINGSTFTATVAGSVTVRASRVAGVNSSTYYVAAPSVDQSFYVQGLSQTITGFATIPSHTYLDVPFQVSASATSSLPVTFSIDSGSATVSGTTVTLTGAGNTTVKATQAGNGTYAPAIATQTFVVAKANQVITFPTVPTHTHGDAPFNPGASSTSGLPITYIVQSGPATAAGSYVTLTGAGSVTLQATQPGNANFNAATVNPTQSFQVNSAIAVAQTSSGATAPAFSVVFSPGVPTIQARLQVTDLTTGAFIGEFLHASPTLWSGSNWAYSTPYVTNTATWTDPRGLMFNGAHNYRFSIVAYGQNGWQNYGPVVASGIVAGGPPGSIQVTPGSGDKANFTIAVENYEYGSGITQLTITDSLGGSWSYPTGTVTESYSTTWTDPRTPTPNSPVHFKFTMTGSVGGQPYSYVTEATYTETILYVQPLSPLNSSGATQPTFNVSVSAWPEGLTYVQIKSGGNTWYLTNSVGPSPVEISNSGATSFSRQFSDPRGSLGAGSYSYEATAFYTAYMDIGGPWVNGHYGDLYVSVHF